MLGTYFGEIKTGKLKRLAYLGYSILLNIIVLAIVFGAIAFVAGIENLSAGNLQETQAKLMQNFGRPAMIAFLLFGAFVAFANANLMAKRFRDMGLAGWWSVLAVIVLSAVVGTVFQNPDPETPALIPGILNAVVWIILLLVPSNAFSRDR